MSCTEYIQGAEEERKTHHTTPLETQVHTSPKAPCCQSIHSNTHTAPYISSDSETCVLTTPHQWTHKVQVVLRPFGASGKQEPACVYPKTMRCTCIHLSLAGGEVPGRSPTKSIRLPICQTLLCWPYILIWKGNS